MDYFKAFGIEVGKGKYFEESIYGLALIYNLLNNAISSYLSPFNLTPAKFNALVIIKHQGEAKGISQVQISKRLIVTASNTTRLLDKLERERLIIRIAREGDRRVKVIKITDKGTKLLDAVWPGYINKLKSLMAKVEHGEQKEFAHLVIKWLNRLSQE